VSEASDSSVGNKRAARLPRRAASAALDYPFTPPAADGSVVEVAPGILWLRQPMPMSLDHINVYLLRDGEGWTLVDTGLNTTRSQELWREIVATRLGGLPLKRLICTHSHYDHAGLAAWLMESYQIPLLMSYGEYFMMRGVSTLPEPLPDSHLRFYQQAGMPADVVARMFEALRRDPFMPEVPPSFERIREGELIRIGSRDWRVVIGEGHSPEHACLYCEEERILLAGDQLLPRITSNVLVSPIEPEADPLRLWLASLDRLDQLAPDTLVLPSHQGVFRGLHARVEELRAHHQQQFDLLLAALDELGAATAYELMLRQFPKRRHPVDDLMALGETIAHLSCLRYQGSLRRVLEEDGCHRFSRLV